jgi:hypothetical protein
LAQVFQTKQVAVAVAVVCYLVQAVQVDMATQVNIMVALVVRLVAFHHRQQETAVVAGVL